MVLSQFGTWVEVEVSHYLKLFLVFRLRKGSASTISYFLVFLFWSVNYTNLVYKLCITTWKCSIHKHGLFYNLFSTDIYERLISTACYFFQLFFAVSRVSKFHNFFLTCLETEASFTFEGFQCCYLCKADFQMSSTFLTFLVQPVNC